MDLSPGLFGWIEADTKKDGKWSRKVTLLVKINGAEVLQGVSCRITINGEKIYHFAANPSHTWTLVAPFSEGDHEILVELGPKTRKLRLHVWKLFAEGEVL